ncbi:MAG TPA: hypothetical protein VFO48_12820 [Vicinamibacterales bacterium]|nr:hypothetical protein [Vicinamibacterales bacterium]
MKVLRRKTPAAAAALVLVLSMLIVPVAAQAQSGSGISIPIVGTIGTTGTFSGAFNLTSFAVRDGQVVALGTLSGVITNAGAIVGTVLSNVVLPVSVTQATCDILHLDLGPLSLNLLGLQVDLSRIVLDITAQAGAGNLLGNLLCAVAGLLDNPGGLARLLNQILDILG